MSFIINTIVITIVVVVVLGVFLLTCALGWPRIMRCLIPDRSHKTPNPETQQWLQDYANNVPTQDPEKTEFKGDPVTSPESTPAVTPRSSRYSTKAELKRSSMREMV